MIFCAFLFIYWLVGVFFILWAIREEIGYLEVGLIFFTVVAGWFAWPIIGPLILWGDKVVSRKK